MRSLISLCALCLCAAPALAAKDLGPVITTTDGCTYVRAADGEYYPAGGPQPVAKAAASPCPCAGGCACSPLSSCGCSLSQSRPAYLPQSYAVPACAGGSCGLPSRSYYPVQQSYYFAPAAGGCANGKCNLPTVVK